MKELLYEVLREFLEETNTGPTRLAKISNVPKKTINHWLSGDVQHPHRWQSLVQVAIALHRNEAQTNRLLAAAGYESVRQLKARAAGADLALLASLNSDVGQTPMHPAAAPHPAAASHPASAAPFRAPPDLTTFVGRAEAMATLRTALLQKGHAVIFGVRGMGGVGKTSLATHAAYELRAEFPDGVLWARLDTSDTLSILLSFADAFGKDVSQYRDVESRAMVVRGVLADKRVLIVLDNADNGQQVEPLLPSSGSQCAVLITTRNDLSPTDGWPSLRLGTFATHGDESLLLFEQLLSPELVKAHEPALRQVADVLGHLPLALAIVGGQLAFALHAEPPSKAAELINTTLDRLLQEEMRLGNLERDRQSVRLSFNWSYTRLPSELQRFFSQLGVFGGQDFDVGAVSAVTETDATTTHAHLTTLVKRSLVEPSQHGRFRLHPLLSDYAREQLAQQRAQHAASVQRSIAYFADYVRRHERDYAAIDLEFGNIAYALNLSLKMSSGFNAFAQHLYFYFETRGLFDQATRIYQQARKLAIRNSDLEAEAHALILLASSRLRLAEYDKVEQLCLRGLAIARKIDHKYLIYRFLHTIGGAYYGRGDFRGLATYDQETLAAARELNDPMQLGMRLSGIGMTVFELGDIKRGRAHLIEGKTITLAHQDYASAAVACINLSEIAMELGELDDALAWAEEGEAYARKIGHLERLSNVLSDLANSKSALGRYAEAERHFDEALKLAKPMPWMNGFVHIPYSLHLLRTGHADAAEAAAQKSLQIAGDIASEEIRAGAQFALAKIRLAQRQPDEARQLAEAALRSYEQRQPIRTKAVLAWMRTAGFTHDASTSD